MGFSMLRINTLHILQQHQHFVAFACTFEMINECRTYGTALRKSCFKRTKSSSIPVMHSA